MTSQEKIRKLFKAHVDIFKWAIRKRGTTQSDYLDVNGNPGVFKKYLKVYRRYGLPCPTCGHAIERIRIAGRSSHFCPVCQK